MTARNTSSAARFIAACGAATLAPVIAATIMAVIGEPPQARLSVIVLFAIFGIPISLFHLIVLGLPAYALLRERWPLTWMAAAIGGFVVAAFPVTFLSLINSGFDTYQAGQTMLIEHGRYTAAGYLFLFKEGAMTGLLGLLGGLAFRIVLGVGGRR